MIAHGERNAQALEVVAGDVHVPRRLTTTTENCGTSSLLAAPISPARLFSALMFERQLGARHLGARPPAQRLGKLIDQCGHGAEVRGLLHDELARNLGGLSLKTRRSRPVSALPEEWKGPWPLRGRLPISLRCRAPSRFCRFSIWGSALPLR